MKLAYSVARYVPSLLRGEAINVGVALEAPESGKVFVKFSGSLSRARLIFPDADTATISLLRKHFKRAVEGDITSEPVFGYAALGHLNLADLVAECRNTILQFSDPAVTLATDPTAELDGLYDTFVAPREPGAARVFGTTQMAPARLRGRLLRRIDQAGLIGPGKFQQQFRVAGTVFPLEFDLGHANGKVDVVQSIALVGAEDVAVNRALLLAARADDIREASKKIGRVIAAADRLEAASPPVKLLLHHDIEVTEIGDPKLLKIIGGLLLQTHENVPSRGRRQ
jgi:Protein of unknown function (DUF3037)